MESDNPLSQAITAHQQGKLDEAEHLYREILKTDPKHPDANHNLGILLDTLNQITDALELFKTATEENPNIEQYWISYTNALVKENKFNEAEVACRKALEFNPGSAEVYNSLGIILNNLGRLDEAETNYKKAIELKPDYSQAYNNLGIILDKIGRLDEAETNYKKATELNPNLVETYINLGITLNKLGKLDEAELSYKKAIELKPDYIEAYNNLGVILTELERFEDAEIILKKAIQLKPDYTESYNSLGALLYKLDKIDEAEASFKKAIELKPDYVEAYNNLANTLKDLDRFDEAEVNYRKAIELKPDFAKAYNNLGSILQKPEDAEKSFKKAIQLEPDYAEAYSNLGVTQYNLARLDEAELNYRKAIELKPNFTKAYINRGHILFLKKEYVLALKDYDICNTKYSRGKSLECLYALGRIDEIYQRINSESELDEKNLHIAAFSSFISYKEKKSTKNNFCKNPINFISFTNLSSHLNDSNFLIDEIIEELKNLKTRWEPDGKATVKGFQSIFDIFKDPLEKMSKLKSIILAELDKYHLKFKDENCTFIKKWPKKKNLVAWHVVLKKQGFQEAHIHSAGWLSGVIYLKVVPPYEKNEGAIEFSLNSNNYFDKNSPKLTYEPKAGDIVLFPSSLHHKTIPFTTDTDRIIISFNLKS